MKKLISSKKLYEARDPYITKHNNKYYRCYTEDSKSASISCADTIDELAYTSGTKVYSPGENREYSNELWPSELHIGNGYCYI